MPALGTTCAVGAAVAAVEVAEVSDGNDDKLARIGSAAGTALVAAASAGAVTTAIWGGEIASEAGACPGGCSGVRTDSGVDWVDAGRGSADGINVTNTVDGFSATDNPPLAHKAYSTSPCNTTTHTTPAARSKDASGCRREANAEGDKRERINANKTPLAPVRHGIFHAFAHELNVLRRRVFGPHCIAFAHKTPNRLMLGAQLRPLGRARMQMAQIAINMPMQ